MPILPSTDAHGGGSHNPNETGSSCRTDISPHQVSEVLQQATHMLETLSDDLDKLSRIQMDFLEKLLYAASATREAAHTLWEIQ